MDVRAQIATAVKELGLNQNDFELVSLYDYEAVLTSILEKFTTLGKKGLSSTWWWEHFKGERFTIQADYAPAIIAQILPPDESAWFVVEDWPRTKKQGNFWLYEGKLSAVLAVIGEMYGFEYCIVAKKFDWLLCENHHSVLIGVGEAIIKKLRLLDEVTLEPSALPDAQQVELDRRLSS